MLLVLADGVRHGYQIAQEVELLSQGMAKGGRGPIYLAAQRLVEAGLVAEPKDRPTAELDDKRRRYYEITRRGRLLVAAEAKQMADLVRAAIDKGLMQKRDPAKG